jgi:tRNA(fMet)-specific endonuclease VapC
MICLDTNAVIRALQGEPPQFLERFRRELMQENLAISAIVLFELHYGVANSAQHAQNARRLRVFLQAPIKIWTFDPEDAQEAGDIRAGLKRAGTPIGPYDLLIAAQARRRNAVLVTSNASEFSRVPGLTIEDWTALRTDRD